MLWGRRNAARNASSLRGPSGFLASCLALASAMAAAAMATEQLARLGPRLTGTPTMLRAV
jgi:hypothetical protein